MKRAIRITSMGIGLLFTQSCMSRVTKTNMGNASHSSNQHPVPEQIDSSVTAYIKDSKMKVTLDSCIAIASFMYPNRNSQDYSPSEEEEKISMPEKWPEKKILEYSNILIKHLSSLNLKFLIDFLIKFRDYTKEKVMERAYTSVVRSIVDNARNFQPQLDLGNCPYSRLYDLARELLTSPEEKDIKSVYNVIANFIREKRLAYPYDDEDEDEDENGEILPLIPSTFLELTHFVNGFGKLPEDNVIKKDCITILAALGLTYTEGHTDYTFEDLYNLLGILARIYLKCENIDQSAYMGLAILLIRENIASIITLPEFDKDSNYTPEKSPHLATIFSLGNPKQFRDLSCKEMVNHTNNFQNSRSACESIGRHITNANLENYTPEGLYKLVKAFAVFMERAQDNESFHEHYETAYTRTAYTRIVEHISTSGLQPYSLTALCNLLEIVEKFPNIEVSHRLKNQICISIALRHQMKNEESSKNLRPVSSASTMLH